MAPARFKLSKPGSVTRRLTFKNLPTWDELAARIDDLYSVDKLGVSYIDVDGDEVTLSSQAELLDFYGESYKASDTIKFVVQDLTKLREVDEPTTPLIETPQTSVLNHANLGGAQIPLTFEADGEWQKLGGLGFQKSIQAAEKPAADGTEIADSVFSSDSEEMTNLSSLDKGKTKAYAASIISSTGSVLAEDEPRKYPVHVYDRSKNFGLSSPIPPSRESILVEEKAEPTPSVAPHSEDDVSDPPLPSLGQTPAAQGPSFAGDLADLFAVLTSAFTANPELREKLHTVVENARSGAYWTAHREAVSRAADDLTRTAPQMRATVEEEAGRRVAEALNGIFGGLRGPNASASAADDDDDAAAPAPAAEPANSAPEFAQTPATPAVQNASTPDPRSAEGAAPNPFVGTPSWFGMPPWAPFRRPRPSDHPSYYPPHHPSRRQGPLPSHHWFPPPPPPPGFPPSVPGAFSPAVPNNSLFGTPSTPGMPTSPRGGALDEENRRLARDALRHNRVRRFSTQATQLDNSIGADSSNAPMTTGITVEMYKPELPMNTPATEQIVSQARGDFPQYDLVNVRRNNTYSGPPRGYRRSSLNNEGAQGRTIQRITRRLEDMGFTEITYPSMASKIKMQTPTDGVVTKNEEDDIVTILLEELLAMGPSTSGTNSKADIPGGWE